MYELKHLQTGKCVKFATDLYDFSDSFSAFALEHCDIIFKRNFEQAHVDELPQQYRRKIKKLGLTFGVHSHEKYDQRKFKWGMYLSNLNVNLKFDREFVSRLARTVRLQKKHWDFIQKGRYIEQFETYHRSSENTIMFQTRCFPIDEQKDVQEIHEQRYRITKLLRKTFPDNFKGGFIPSPLALKKFPDAISNVPSEPLEYIAALKNARIVIYTRGLAKSPAWKMAEYLSQGKVIIAERLTAELPVPLQNEKEVLFFDSDEELIHQIYRVLKDEQLADALSNNARMYFENYIHPKKSVRRIIDIMEKDFL
ncbi:glycosyltransferase [Gangjinia marincola]|uniref:glycosyltransferase n=1 Tax=Gangjinia marincola TaxID=578463 RepID=UPI0031D00855